MKNDTTTNKRRLSRLDALDNGAGNNRPIICGHYDGQATPGGFFHPTRKPNRVPKRASEGGGGIQNGVDQFVHRSSNIPREDGRKKKVALSWEAVSLALIILLGLGVLFSTAFRRAEISVYSAPVKTWFISPADIRASMDSAVNEIDVSIKKAHKKIIITPKGDEEIH